MSEPRHPRISIDTYGRSGPPGRFCMVCGTALVERNMPDGFERDTGEPRFIRRRDCPEALAESKKEHR